MCVCVCVCVCVCARKFTLPYLPAFNTHRLSGKIGTQVHACLSVYVSAHASTYSYLLLSQDVDLPLQLAFIHLPLCDLHQNPCLGEEVAAKEDRRKEGGGVNE